MDIARASGRSVRAQVSTSPGPSGRRRTTPPVPTAALAPSDNTLLPAQAAALAMPIEEQARTLLSAVARPDDAIGNADAAFDYIMHLLVDTEVLSGLLVDLLRDGALDRDLRNVLGALFGLYAAPVFAQGSELKQLEAALAHVEGWYTELRAKGEQVLDLDMLSEARCPISCKHWAELDFPVAIDVGAVACVFEAQSLLQWMQVSMQTPGRKGVALNPLDRSGLQLGQLKAVRWVQSPQASPFL